jgi:hypothetical protein
MLIQHVRKINILSYRVVSHDNYITSHDIFRSDWSHIGILYNTFKNENIYY